MIWYKIVFARVLWTTWPDVQFRGYLMLKFFALIRHREATSIYTVHPFEWYEQSLSSLDSERNEYNRYGRGKISRDLARNATQTHIRQSSLYFIRFVVRSHKILLIYFLNIVVHFSTLVYSLPIYLSCKNFWIIQK